MGQYFEIIGHNNVTAEIGDNGGSAFHTYGKQIKYRGVVLGEFETEQRAGEIFEQLIDAFTNGANSFIFPEF